MGSDLASLPFASLTRTKERDGENPPVTPMTTTNDSANATDTDTGATAPATTSLPPVGAPLPNKPAKPRPGKRARNANAKAPAPVATAGKGKAPAPVATAVKTPSSRGPSEISLACLRAVRTVLAAMPPAKRSGGASFGAIQSALAEAARKGDVAAAKAAANVKNALYGARTGAAPILANTDVKSGVRIGSTYADEVFRILPSAPAK